MRLLELFCGTKSVSKIFDGSVVSLDIDKKWSPTICKHFLEWDYESYDKKYFDVIWASPECKTWSNATGKHRLYSENLKCKTEEAFEANLMIKKLIRVLNYFEPTYWFVENPEAKLRIWPPWKKFIEDHYQTTVYYGNYDTQFVKPTNIWSNVELWTEIRPKKGSKSINGRKEFRGQNLFPIPEKLIRRIFEHCRIPMK